MGAQILRGENYVPYLLIPERTWPELMALDPAAEVGRVYAVNDWGTRCYFESDGTYWRPHNGIMLLHKWDLSNLSATYTELTPVVGFSSPTFPWDYLLAVPGCRLDTGLSSIRQNPSNSQNCIIELLLPPAVTAARFQAITANISVHADGVVEYASPTGVFQSGPSMYKNLSFFDNLSSARPTDGAVILRARTGDAGGAEVIQFCSMQMVYSA